MRPNYLRSLTNTTVNAESEQLLRKSLLFFLRRVEQIVAVHTMSPVMHYKHHPFSWLAYGLLLLLTLVCATPLQAQGAATVGALAASLTGLEHVANNAIEKADNALSAQQRQLYANAVNYAALIRGLMGDALKDVDRKLTAHELNIFNEVRSMTGRLETAAQSTAAEIKTATIAIENAAARAPFGKDYPAPSDVKIPLLTTTQARTILIEIQGVNLGHKDNYIVFAGKKIASIRESDKRLAFRVPLTVRDRFDYEKFNTFELVLHKKGLFGTKQWRYTPRFIVVPEQIATVKVFFRLHGKERQESNGQSGIVHATSGNRKTKDKEAQFNVVNPAAEGWKIDRNSIAVRKTRGDGDKHGVGGPYAITEISFVAKAFAKNGHATATASWNEYRIVDTGVAQVSEVAVRFNEQQVVELPENLSSFVKAEISYYDGSKVVTSDAHFRRNMVDVDFKQAQKVCEVKFVP
jgi:hypothetical protein